MSTSKLLSEFIPRSTHLNVREAASFLLVIPAVQAELKMTGEQVRSLQDLLNDYTLAQRKVYETRKMEIGADSDRKNQSSLEELDRLYAKKWAGVISIQQQERLKQLGLQGLGSEALVRPEIAQELKLEMAQIAKLASLRARFEGLQRDLQVDLGQDLMKIVQPDPAKKEDLERYKTERNAVLTKYDARRDAIKAEREKLEADSFAILSPEQRLKWSAMLGKVIRE